MNSIETMIKELCPNGVEYKMLSEVIDIKTGRLNANAMEENGIYPFFTCDSKPYKINNYAFDTTAIIVSGNGSQVGHINYYKGKFNAYQRTYVFDNFKNCIDKYLFHYLKTFLKPYIIQKSKKGSVPYITLPMLEIFQIPLPPLSIQQQIVEILDNFTQLEANLEANLEAELEARKKQYEYYREQLLINANGVEWKTIGEIGSIIRGKRFCHRDAVESGTPCIHYGEIYTYYGLSTESTKSFVREDLVPKLRFAKNGDVVIVGAGENDIDIGIGVAYMGEEPVAVHDACYTLSNHNMNPKFISYWLRTNTYHQQIKQYVSSGKICSISADGVSNARIPVPPIEEQNRIVSILDKFEALTTSLIDSLHAEIMMRKQQYEHYKDELLTFKRKEA